MEGMDLGPHCTGPNPIRRRRVLPVAQLRWALKGRQENNYAHEPADARRMA